MKKINNRVRCNIIEIICTILWFSLIYFYSLETTFGYIIEIIIIAFILVLYIFWIKLSITEYPFGDYY